MGAVSIASVALAGCGGGDSGTAPATRAAPAAAKPVRPAVVASPRNGPPGTVFEFRGSGWRPGAAVEAHYGPYCPGSACRTIAYAKRFHADAQGRFVFRFRDGPDHRGLPQPAAAGSALVVFEQWTGRSYRSKLVRVRPRYSIRR